MHIVFTRAVCQCSWFSQAVHAIKSDLTLESLLCRPPYPQQLLRYHNVTPSLLSINENNRPSALPLALSQAVDMYVRELYFLAFISASFL